jgi:hypothetical protein
VADDRTLSVSCSEHAAERAPDDGRPGEDE